MRLEGKTALITGASRGIGQAIAQAFAREGARLVLSARTPGVVKLAHQLRDLGHEVEAVQGDVSDNESAKTLVQLCRSRFGQLDILVNNAGILTPGNLGMVRMEDARRMFEVNVLAMMNLTQFSIRLFPKGEGGSVVNMASIAGTQGIAGISAYSASKAAVVGFTRAAAKELASQRIRVNAIAPGFIDTDMARQVSPEWFQKRVDGILLGRIGHPSEIASCAVFLASDEARYVTGQILGVDGAMAV